MCRRLCWPSLERSPTSNVGLYLPDVYRSWIGLFCNTGTQNLGFMNGTTDNFRFQKWCTLCKFYFLRYVCRKLNTFMSKCNVDCVHSVHRLYFLIFVFSFPFFANSHEIRQDRSVVSWHILFSLVRHAMWLLVASAGENRNLAEIEIWRLPHPHRSILRPTGNFVKARSCLHKRAGAHYRWKKA